MKTRAAAGKIKIAKRASWNNFVVSSTFLLIYFLLRKLILVAVQGWYRSFFSVLNPNSLVRLFTQRKQGSSERFDAPFVPWEASIGKSCLLIVAPLFRQRCLVSFQLLLIMSFIHESATKRLKRFHFAKVCFGMHYIFFKFWLFLSWH